MVLLPLDWRLGLVMTLPVPLFCWLIYRHGEWLNRVFIRAWRKWSGVTDVLSDTIPGIRVVKAFNQETREVGRFGERNEDVTEEFNRIHAMWTTFWPLLMIGVQATTVLGVGVRGAAVAGRRARRCRRACSCRSCCTRRCSWRRSRSSGRSRAR